jgi:predicted phosphodiesterase
MKIAALYDIHGNIHALEAVLEEVPAGATIVLGGDTVFGPWPRETLDRLRALGDGAIWIRGNADRERNDWLDARLSEDEVAFLASAQPTCVLQVDGLGPTLFCHGTPRSDEEMVTAVTSDERLRRILDGIEERTVVGGHVHHQFDRTVDGFRWVNAGSVGLAYEGRPGAHWALLGPDVELRRTDYDAERAVAELPGDYPDRESLVEWLLTDVPAARDVAEYFESQALEREAS